MAARAEYDELADALLEVLQGAPYRREASAVAEGQISRIRTRAEEFVAGTIERDYRNLSTTLRQQRLRFAEQAVASWSRPAARDS